MNWDRLYSVLKMTREGKDNAPIEDGWYKQQIEADITIREIEQMKEGDIKEAVINYLEVLVPGIRKK